MKRTLWLAIGLMMASTAVMAQQEAHTWAITPKVGATMSHVSGTPSFDYLWAVTSQQTVVDGQIHNYDGSEVAVGSVSTDRQHNRFGFTIGAEAQYQFTKLFGLSMGVYYTQLGGDFHHLGTKNDAAVTSEVRSIDIDNPHFQLDYIQVPLLANVYLWRGLAVKAGLEANFCVNQKAKGDVTTLYDDGTTDKKSQSDKLDYRNFELSLPVGLSYEWHNIVADLRYNIGLTNLVGGDWVGGPKPTNRNTSLSLTVGYKFTL